MNNYHMIKAKKEKNDEFYTQLSDIEKELSNYSAEAFKDKIIYCPCDVGVDGLDVPKSNFVKYFEMNKERLGYKQLLHTSLQEGNDFNSDFCRQLLKSADIVITNPPFSIFRDFLNWLLSENKDFLILAKKDAINYKEIFEMFKTGKLHYGFSIHSGERYFEQPDNKGLSKGIGVRWFSTLNIKEHIPFLELTETYKDNEISYPKYDFYDAIEVDKTKKIPKDYLGLMGVPITFLDKYNPNQFELIDSFSPILYDRTLYRRIIIKRR